MTEQMTWKDIILKRGLELVYNKEYYDWLIAFSKANGYVTTDAVIRHYGRDEFSKKDKENICLLPFFYMITRQMARERDTGYYKKESDSYVDSYIILEDNNRYFEVHQINNNSECQYFFTSSTKNRVYNGTVKNIFYQKEKVREFKKVKA
ncbi:MAG: hypothetical protein RSA48_03910 [Bacilli bacterium]